MLPGLRRGHETAHYGRWEKAGLSPASGHGGHRADRARESQVETRNGTEEAARVFPSRVRIARKKCSGAATGLEKEAR